jgi:signal transduction histidine kinase
MAIIKQVDGWDNTLKSNFTISIVDDKVSDDGIGIAPENHTKIFSIFQTLVCRENFKGTGVGLTIVKKIVESRGGTLWLESDLGEGCAFSFTWPKQ